MAANVNKQPNAFKGSIDTNTRQTSYNPSKGIDYKNKTKEYNPPNKYYNVDFNSEKKKTTPVSKPVQPKPKSQPAAKPKPEPKPASQPKPKPQAKPWPAAAKVVAKKEPVAPEAAPEPEPAFEVAPESVHAPQPEPERVEWGEPVRRQPIAAVAAAAPVAIPIGAGLAVSLWPANRSPGQGHRGRVIYHGKTYLPSHSHGHGCPCDHCREAARYNHHHHRDYHNHHDYHHHNHHPNEYHHSHHRDHRNYYHDHHGHHHDYHNQHRRDTYQHHYY